MIAAISPTEGVAPLAAPPSTSLASARVFTLLPSDEAVDVPLMAKQTDASDVTETVKPALEEPPGSKRTSPTRDHVTSNVEVPKIDQHQKIAGRQLTDPSPDITQSDDADRLLLVFITPIVPPSPPPPAPVEALKLPDLAAADRNRPASPQLSMPTSPPEIAREPTDRPPLRVEMVAPFVTATTRGSDTSTESLTIDQTTIDLVVSTAPAENPLRRIETRLAALPNDRMAQLLRFEKAPARPAISPPQRDGLPIASVAPHPKGPDAATVFPTINRDGRDAATEPPPALPSIEPPRASPAQLPPPEGPAQPGKTATAPPSASPQPAGFAVDTAALGAVGAEVTHRDRYTEALHVHFAVDRSQTADLIAGASEGLGRALAAVGNRLDAVTVELRGGVPSGTNSGSNPAFGGATAHGDDPRRHAPTPQPSAPLRIRTPLTQPVVRDRFA